MSKAIRIRLLVALSLTALIAVGCGKGPSKTGGKSVAAKKKNKPVVPSLKIPDSLFMYAGAKNPTATLTQLKSVADQVQPGAPDPVAMATALLQHKFRLTAATGMDLNKPIALALFSPKLYGRDPSATLIGITDQAKLEATLPKTVQKKNDAGNAFSYRKWATAKYPVYVNFVGRHVVLTRHRDTFPKNKDFLTQLAKHDFKEQGSVFVSAKNAMNVYQDSFQRQVKRITDQVQSQVANVPNGQQGAKMVGWMLDGVVNFANGMDFLTLGLQIKPDGIKIDVNMTAKAGTGMAKAWSVLSGGKHDFLAQFPSDSPAFVSMAFGDGKSLALLTELYTKSLNAMSSMTGMSPAMVKKLRPFIDAWTKGIDGRMVMVAHTYPGTQGLTPSMSFGVKDGKAVRSAMEGLMKAFKDDPSIAAAYAKMGVKVEQTMNAYAIDGAPVTFKTTTLLNAPPQAALFSDMMETHFVIGKSLGAMAFGPSAKVELGNLLSKKYSGLNKKAGVGYVMKNSATNPFIVAFVSPIELAQKLKLGGMNPMAVALADIKAASGLGFSMGQTNGSLQVVINLPTALLKDGVSAIGKVKGAL